MLERGGTIRLARRAMSASRGIGENSEGETDLHWRVSVDLIETLRRRYLADSQVYVSGNLLVFYEPGNRRRHVTPDVFMVRGVPNKERLNYLIWTEARGPEVVI